MMKNYLILLSSGIILMSCIKDKPSISTPQYNVSISGSHKVYITNEGNFMYNNASVTFYNPESKDLISNIFQVQNPGYTLGDVCQSIYKIGNTFYLVINNSGKVVIVNAEDFKVKQTMYGFLSPRYILPVSFSKGYVSDLYANKIAVVNLSTHSITSYIPCAGWTERMVQFYNKVFVTNLYKNYVYSIDVLSDQITDSIYVGKYASGIVLDKNEKLWVLTQGDHASNQVAHLYRINPVSHQIEKQINFTANDSPHHLIIDSKRENLFFINKDIYKMSINDNTLPSQYFISSNGRNFYSMAWSYFDDHLYVSDAMDYIQNSTIYRYDANAQLIHSFKAGINASDFWIE